MSKTLLAIGTIAILGSLLLLNQDLSVENHTKAFENFKAKYNKRYGSTEEAYRLAVFTQNVLYAQAYNMKKGRNVFGVTQFFDLTDEEFAETYLTLKVDESEKLETVKLPFDASVTAVDWVAQGAVTPIKDQGQCGSCWTFGTTGVLEGHFFIKEGKLTSFSEQQLLDCSTWLDLNFGCNGGMPSRALNYVKRKGIVTEEEYPYTAVQGTCAPPREGVKVTGHVAVGASETELLAAIQKQPVSVGVDATNWKYYDPTASKIFSDCESTLNHAVLAVGYDNDSIKIKNSWSTAWGDNGYIHLKRGQNTCGVWNTSVLPTTA